MLAIKYLFFAVIAIIFNLVVQIISNAVYKGLFSIYFGLFLGTLAGLILKFLLDRKYIFPQVTKGIVKDIRKFILYCLTGVLTTSIFWGVEIGFDLIFSSDEAKYYGGAIGLSIGYLLKYFLDKNIVFKTQRISS